MKEQHIKDQIYLSLVVPAFNEEARIGETLEQLIAFLQAQQYTWEVIVVDDGSRDGTAKVAGEAAASAGTAVSILRNGANRGKGYSVRRGVLAARGDHVFFTDADLSTPIEEIANCLPLLANADVVIGSRALPGSNITLHQPAHREALGRLFNKVAQLATVPGIKDSQCGFKGFRQQAAVDTFRRQRLNGFGFDIEVIYIAKKLGHKVVEAPITWRNSASSRVNPLQDGLGMLGDLVRVRLNDIKGLYD